MTTTGGLIMSAASGRSPHGSANFLGPPFPPQINSGLSMSVEGGEIAREFPQFVLEGNEMGYFEDAAGSCVPSDV